MTTSFQKPFELGGQKFAFEKPNLSLKFFEQFANYAVIDQKEIDLSKNPLGIIDAVQITAVPGGVEEKTAAIIKLVTKHGAQPVQTIA